MGNCCSHVTAVHRANGICGILGCLCVGIAIEPSPPIKRYFKNDPLAGKAWAKNMRSEPCHYCGRPGGTVDHKTPLARGGANSKENCVPACGSCNRLKAGIDYQKFVGLLKRRAEIIKDQSLVGIYDRCPRCGERNHRSRFQTVRCGFCKCRFRSGDCAKAIGEE